MIWRVCVSIGFNDMTYIGEAKISGKYRLLRREARAASISTGAKTPPPWLVRGPG